MLLLITVNLFENTVIEQVQYNGSFTFMPERRIFVPELQSLHYNAVLFTDSFIGTRIFEFNKAEHNFVYFVFNGGAARGNKHIGQ